MAYFSTRTHDQYGFIEDVIDSNFVQGDRIPIGFSNLVYYFNGSVGATDRPQDNSPHLESSSAMKPTQPENAWKFQSPTLTLYSGAEPQEDDLSSPAVAILEDGQASVDEEEPSVIFQSKYINIFPLYQDYSLVAVRDGIQRLKEDLSSELVKSESCFGLCSSSGASPNLEVPCQASYLTPDSSLPPSPSYFTGRRSAVRRHTHSGVPSPLGSPDSVTDESSFHERAASFNTKRPKVNDELRSGDSSPIRNPRFSSGMLWQDLEEVKASGLADILTPEEIGLQECMFELIGSEVSYLKSLGVLVNHFYTSKELAKTISETDHYTLFHNIHNVMEANTKFLLDLEARLGESLQISQVGDIVLQHCGNFQQHYVPYVTNMMNQESLVNQLLQENKAFVYVLKKLEKNPVCQKQTLKSFLVLPFQRITRIKLLLEGILKRTTPDTEVATNLKGAIKRIHEIVLKCEQKVEWRKRLQELVRLEALLDFADMKPVALVKSTRFLIHHGPLATVEAYGSRVYTTRIYLHLFNDLLIISSKKYQRFAVQDYALFPEHVTVLENKVLGLPLDSFLVILSHSQTGTPITMILMANESFEKEVWIKALSKK